LEFSRQIVLFSKSLPRNTITISIIDQLIRCGTAIGANYIEANDALGKKDFILRVKISRKEAKETIYWLRILKDTINNSNEKIDFLVKECIELKNILSTIIKNASI